MCVGDGGPCVGARSLSKGKVASSCESPEPTCARRAQGRSPPAKRHRVPSRFCLRLPWGRGMSARPVDNERNVLEEVKGWKGLRCPL